MLSPTLRKAISELALQKPKAIKLSDLYRFGKSPALRQQNAIFLHRELPIRLAQRVEELHYLPYGLSKYPDVVEVRNLYGSYCERLMNAECPNTEEAERAFEEACSSALARHANVGQMLALGVRSLKDDLGSQYNAQVASTINASLDRFFMARIGLRFLLAHHIETKLFRPGFSGIIEASCKPAKVLSHAAEDAIAICARDLGVAPEIRIEGHKECSFTYVPSHLHYMLFEILKNATRAVVETHENGKSLPPIRAVIADGAEDITIKIMDEGGGIPRSSLPDVMSYMHTTAELTPDLRDDYNLASNSVPLAGFGVGLPLSRLYAMYFGGSLELASMDGFGTDAYLHLNRLGNECENLPKLVGLSPGAKDSTNMP